MNEVINAFLAKLGEFFEAKIEFVDRSSNTCTISRTLEGSVKKIEGVPLPQLSGNSDRGVYLDYPKGTKVLAFFAPAITVSPVTIISVLSSVLFPKSNNESIG